MEGRWPSMPAQMLVLGKWGDLKGFVSVLGVNHSTNQAAYHKRHFVGNKSESGLDRLSNSRKASSLPPLEPNSGPSRLKNPRHSYLVMFLFRPTIFQSVGNNAFENPIFATSGGEASEFWGGGGANPYAPLTSTPLTPSLRSPVHFFP